MLKVATSQGVSHLGIRLRHASFMRGMGPPRRWARGPREGVVAARHAGGGGRHVVEGQRHRDAGVEAHQGDHIRNADVAEDVDRAVIEPLRHPARIGKARRHLVDDLLALVGERGR